jgi:hypothetical protein
MNVVPFRDIENLLPGWRSVELEKLVGACQGALAAGDASEWDIGTTETGDPQLYLIGPAPEHDCILCVSRLGRHYVLEDGHGRILFEHQSLVLLGEQAWALLGQRKAAFAAKILLAWATIRSTLEEKVEPMLEGPAELFTHVAPQIAAMA